MKTKKLITSILIFSAVIIASMFINTVEAESLGKISITKERKVDNIIYRHQLYSDNTKDTKNIWKLATCNDDGTITNKIPDLYCLRAGLGFTSESLDHTIVEYTDSYSMSTQYAEIVNYFKGRSSKTNIFNEDKFAEYNSVMWVLDNMLLEGATEEELTAYLKTYAGYTDATLNKAEGKENVLTRADIEAIQQLAIWYFTNSDEAPYHKDTLPSLYLSITGGDYDTGKQDNKYIYEVFSDIFNIPGPDGLPVAYGTQRQTQAAVLYNTLITKAKEAAAKGKYEPDREITLYLAGSKFADEQPVVRVEKKVEIDLSLRKYIAKLNGVELTGENLRAPKVDTTPLDKGTDTTAIYNHTKKPLKVSVDDIVTYRIRVYNEGEIDAYVKEITDNLPEYLVFYPESGTEEESWWLLDEATGRIAVSSEFCKIVGASDNLKTAVTEGKKLGEVCIPKATKNETGKYTLSYVEVEIPCKVMPKAPYDKNITNIAQITKMANKNEIPIEADRDSFSNKNMKLPEDNMLSEYTGGKNGKNDPHYDGSNVQTSGTNTYYPGQEDDDDFEKVYIETPTVDLALRKFITAVGEETYDRAPKVITSGLEQGATTATYNHTKNPVAVKIGDIVTYTLRIYNEGAVNARVTEVTDHLDKHLKYVAGGQDKNKDWYSETSDENYNILKTTDKCKVVNVSDNLEKSYIGGKLGDVILPAYNEQTKVISYVDIEVHCEVLEVEETMKVTNIANITKQADEYGITMNKDRDSIPEGNLKLPEREKLPEYTGGKNGKNDPYYDGSNCITSEGGTYYPGQEDDDDFEKIIVVVPEIDLSLRKYISAVDGEKLTGENSREPKVDTTPLDNKTGTTAIYNHTKKPITVKKGSNVTYTIRVYNEGEVNGYVNEITDYLPNYLIYLPENETNKKYKWSYDEKTKQIKTTITAKENAEGDKIYKDRENGKLLLKYDGSKKLNYIDVEVVCKVDETAEGKGILTNLAQITEIKDEGGKKVEKDKDSKPNGNFDPQPEDKKPIYKDEESNKPYVPGQEDDDDFEKVLVKPEFDLALRKFITKVGNIDVKNRYPQVIYENGKLSYKHTKEPVDLVTGDVVTYTIRIYNEGEADGYANEITDDVPEGLEFLPKHETNTEYRWKMLDENQKETTEVTKAKYIITDYLSEEQEKETKRKNLLKAFNKEGEITEENPDHKDVKIAFKVTHKAKTEEESARTIVNTAQISADSDDDIDSIPNRDEVYDHKNNKNEDDIDYDQVRVKYFDLSLLKWVGQVQITKNGKTTTTNTGHNASNSKNEDQVKIEIKESEINKIKIKYIYTIRITNEGQIEGYAKEITDYIPKGLIFDEKDNPDWYKISDGVVGTKKLENTKLKPGESAEVKIILRWDNNKNNFGEKINEAEISKDYNDSGSPDIDSTPNNRVKGEDDIDDAPVILTIKTGNTQIYIGLTLIICVTLAGGISLIKKYVLE